MRESIINVTYLVSSVLFIVGLKGLSHPRTAIRGNLLGALAMLLAIVVTLIDRHVVSYSVIAGGFVVGGVVGAIMALRIAMTAMPQMVALLNGFGGGASVLVAAAALIEATVGGEGGGLQLTTATAASGLIGAVTFWGSLVAFAKLQELISGNAMRIPMQKTLNILLALGCVAMGVMLVREPTNMLPYWILVGLASILGFTLTLPIGGADMPVVIALLNSYSGIAAAATGFVLNNTVLVIAGSLVGASGVILTQIMCKAMNRSLVNVLFGTLQAGESGPSADDVYAGKVKSTSAEEIAMLFDTAQRVVIVPGYGMAVSQAQHAVRDLANLLEAKGITVEYAIHPVAGRMPGHMNVLLAEANVDYDKLIEMDAINPTMETVDVCVVIGANDVVNPVARDPKSIIAGMPIIDVDKARTVVVVKRSLSPGFAGIPNPLFAADNCLMFFSDGKKAIMDIIAAVKEAA
ncbi:MAG TPA: NAD(P)(+) transhydrogenase (Re/Si-specific) subunit beta [Candidatus Krumholzibacteria bacterium]|nr:NAD(P)(+) transhydrogenase (Re/Si-specific) subunit beta [Candidatus Krumholzibacteria bacterium]